MYSHFTDMEIEAGSSSVTRSIAQEFVRDIYIFLLLGVLSPHRTSQQWWLQGAFPASFASDLAISAS